MKIAATTLATSWHGPVRGARMIDSAHPRPNPITFATAFGTEKVAVNDRPTRRGAPPH